MYFSSSCWSKDSNEHRGRIMYQLDSFQERLYLLHVSSIFDNRQSGEFCFQLIWTWPDFETFFLNLRSFWVRSLHSFEARFVSHMRSAPSKSWPAPAQNIVCGSARAALRLWRDFIIGSYRMGRDGQTAAEIDPENLPLSLLLCHINEHPELSY